MSKIKTRAEVRDIMYEIADGIRANADKYANGNSLCNDDWVGLSTKLAHIMVYIGNNRLDPTDITWGKHKED